MWRQFKSDKITICGNMNKRAGIVGISIVLLLVFSPGDSEPFEGRLRFAFSVSRLSDGTSLRDPLGLDVSMPSGDILVADTGNNQIRIFNSDGVLIKSIGRLIGIRSPIGIAVGENEDIYFSEIGNPHIRRLDFSGGPLPPILLTNSTPIVPQPGRICMGRDGKLYITDRAAPRVFAISLPDGDTREMAQEPNEAEPRWKVQDVAVDETGNVFIISSQGLAVHVFDSAGVHMRSFGVHGAKEHEFSFPTGAAIGPEGNLWVVDSVRQEIKVFTPDGDFQFRWGVTGAGDGDLFYPIDIVFGKRTLYVLEKGASRLQAFELR